MRRVEEIRAAFARFEKSGLTLKAFGEREQIPYTTLQYWRRKLRDAAEAAPGGSEGKPAWARVDVVPDPAPDVARSTGFDVWLANGVTLEIPHDFDEDELRRLVGVLSTC
jgi:hypothetical protein